MTAIALVLLMHHGTAPMLRRWAGAPDLLTHALAVGIGAGANVPMGGRLPALAQRAQARVAAIAGKSLCCAAFPFNVSHMRPLLLIQTGEAPDALLPRFGGFADWFRSAMRLEPAQMHVVRVHEGQALPGIRDIAGAVITGSAAMVTDRADWSERTAAWIRESLRAALPLFGVCYGHQLMAHALGGTVGWLPAGREIGTQGISRHACAACTWPDGLPDSFPAHTTHRQSVLEPPPGAEVLARSERDPHQLLRYAPHAWSTQFHPEFTVAVMRAYIAARAAALREEGFDATALDAGVRETEAARGLLERFARMALSRNRAAA